MITVNCPNCDCVIHIDETPTWASVRENKHGHWIGGELIPNNESGLFYAECSECHKVRVIDNFCPSCGAKMDL